MKRLLLLLIGIALGIFIAYKLIDTNLFDFNLGQKIKEKIAPEKVETISSDALLEQIRRVYKVVVVEGQFSDILNYKKDYKYYGYSIPGFRKKAIVKIRANVSVGYDLEKLKLETVDSSRIIRVYNLPEPRIMAIDHDLSYFDLDEGIFNEFNEGELTKLNRAAKDSIRAQALRSNMMEIAEQQIGELFTMFVYVAEQNSWKVEFIDPNAPPKIELPKPIEKDTTKTTDASLDDRRTLRLTEDKKL